MQYQFVAGQAYLYKSFGEEPNWHVQVQRLLTKEGDRSPLNLITPECWPHVDSRLRQLVNHCINHGTWNKLALGKGSHGEKMVLIRPNRKSFFVSFHQGTAEFVEHTLRGLLAEISTVSARRRLESLAEEAEKEKRVRQRTGGLGHSCLGEDKAFWANLAVE